VIIGNPRGSLAKPPRKGLRGLLGRQIYDQRPRLDPRASARARTNLRARAVSDRGQGSGLTSRASTRGTSGRQVGSRHRVCVGDRYPLGPLEE
jgi:hypothetical protein